MVVDLSSYRSHPDKELVRHTQGVLDGTLAHTSLKIAGVAAIFHDVGKLNPNFQKKLDDRNVRGYSNHAYYSAFAFLCYCLQNQKEVLEQFEGRREWVASILALIARHHGNLPNFSRILNPEEVDRLLNFIAETPELPASEFIAQWISHQSFSVKKQPEGKVICSNMPASLTRKIAEPLRYFLDTQFAFASLIAADKTDASGYASDEEGVEAFCRDYTGKLKEYLTSLPQDSDLNCLRTAMRIEACNRIREELQNGKRLFELMAPTGSGKTLMLLALAGEILKQHGPLRIIYALPFLSITEQVEGISEKVFGDLAQHIRRVDSKAQNPKFESLQKQLDDNPKPEVVKEILAEQFAEETFDYPFIVTTFVRLFETLVSNRNATLLKLPNFSKVIFLIDEIQALPPRLYGFFVALLGAFCRKFDAYAIISTATMPNFVLPTNSAHDLQDFFPGYMPPAKLLSKEYFTNSLFNRYTVQSIPQEISIDELADKVVGEESALIILNTIQDTKDLFERLRDTPGVKVRLLNTHFTPNHRQEKIEKCKQALKDGERVLLITTQLIEAGVDIDFPVVYRDISPVPNIVQSAGRCNREGKLGNGRIVVFRLCNNGRGRAELIYRGKDTSFLTYAKKEILGGCFHEPELLRVQRGFFDFQIREQTRFGVHYGSGYEGDELDFIARMREAAFEEIGKFRLIDDQEFGEEYSFYVPGCTPDDEFMKLKDLHALLLQVPFGDHKQRRLKRLALQRHLKRMSANIVQARLKDEHRPEAMSTDECCSIWKLRTGFYDKAEGLRTASSAII